MPKQRDGDRVPEHRRRARIVARYAAIPRPTREDDERFAAELGLSPDSLVRLAKTWLLHRDEALLSGSAAAAREHGAARDRVFAREVSLDRVPEGVREETMRRIRAIQAHLAAVEAGSGDIDAAAAALGLSANRFGVLVRAWQVHAEASALPGSGPRRRAVRRLDPARARMLGILRGIVRREGPDARITRIDRIYRKSCATAGLTPLSVPRVYSLVLEMRREAVATDQTSDASE